MLETTDLEYESSAVILQPYPNHTITILEINYNHKTIILRTTLSQSYYKSCIQK